MCGITGIVTTAQRATREELATTVQAMTDRLARRGPDASGVWVDERASVALGHRRLSIVDLSMEGRQPMTGPSRRFVIAFNGEIYNHVLLRKELAAAGIEFRGHSDTEALVAGLEVWGVRDTLSKCVGMFAFAAWDNHEKVLYLARDRMGEKPLYYGQLGNEWVFASELGALREHPAWTGELDVASLGLFLRYGYVPGPRSIFSGMHKLMPGTFFMIRPDGREPGRMSAYPEAVTGIRPTYYWDIAERAQTMIDKRSPLSDAQAIAALDRTLREAVDGQMVADVPLGAFLSGGVDSSLIVSLMQSISDRPINTYTIGFGEKEFNEADHARAIAGHLGTDHTELCVTPAMTLDMVPKVTDAYDEPFADSSQLPMMLLSQMARRHVTVCLTGDGGDELFCGYNRYIYADAIFRQMSRYPATLRKMIAALLSRLPAKALHDCLRRLAPVYPKFRSLNNANIEGRVAKLVNALDADSLTTLYRGLVSYWDPATVLTVAADSPPEYLSEEYQLSYATTIDQLMYWDLRTYLPDDNLVKGDRASMYSSLETRLPLLDHRVVELALSIPLNQKIRGGKTKWLMREALYQYVPPALIDRPKMGFSVPMAQWLRGELREWADDLLSARSLSGTGLLKTELVHHHWREHQSGRADHSSRLWTILMLQAWLART